MNRPLPEVIRRLRQDDERNRAHNIRRDGVQVRLDRAVAQARHNLWQEVVDGGQRHTEGQADQSPDPVSVRQLVCTKVVAGNGKSRRE